MFRRRAGRRRPIESRSNERDWVDARDLSRPPSWLKHAGDPFWFEHLADSRTLYVQYNQVSNKTDETVEAFATRLFAFAESHPVDRIVFDLRWNGGGNHGLNLPLLRALIKSRLDERGRVFVLTSRHTFSAAQNFVNLLERFTNAIFVGEPTGGRPNHYGDARAFVLPESRLEIQASTHFWQDMDPRDNRTWTPPQVAVAMAFEDYRTGSDPVLRAAITYTSKRPLAERMLDAYTANDPLLAARQYREFRADPTNQYASVEVEVNRLGYRLLAMGRIDAAVEALKLNVEAYPDSWNAHDSLGEAYLRAGNRELAAKSYRRSVEINPENVGGRQALEQLNRP